MATGSYQPQPMGYQHPPPPHQQHDQMQQPPPPQQQQQQPQQPPSTKSQQPQQHYPRYQQHPLNLRILLTRDEVNYLFGYDGVLLGQLRQQTGAKISLTAEQGAVEQVLTLGGSLDLIFKAFSLICRKLWDFIASISDPSNPRPLVIRLAVPASQCGPIIGKQGAKVREIKELTGAVVKVAQDTLPGSTERCVEVTGSGESCLQCAYHICVVLQETSLRGEVVLYVPRAPVQQPLPVPPHSSGQGNSWRPVFLCGEKAYVIEGNVAVPAPAELLQRELTKVPLGDMAESRAPYKNV